MVSLLGKVGLVASIFSLVISVGFLINLLHPYLAIMLVFSSLAALIMGRL